MEEAAPSSLSNKSLSDLALEGQKQLEASVNAAHQILESLHEVLNNPSLWVVPSAMPQSHLPTTGADSSSGAKNSESRAGGSEATAVLQQLPEPGWAALDDARLRYRSSTAALRAVLTAIFTNPQMREGEEPAANSEEKKDDEGDLQKLEQRASELREVSYIVLVYSFCPVILRLS
ncbi:hypothetical protein O6H91_09G015700 [Diphasiastrum complanatum]|uniref:Uncharacterized protein n=1 Tax=Diphasiastrum complanatum TaxID=34168 RepID=A0ACC2CLN5_DIPCM|nr:hypothetical protein O6H91_09G015700 [Diphasiastrum complanatum]